MTPTSPPPPQSPPLRGNKDEADLLSAHCLSLQDEEQNPQKNDTTIEEGYNEDEEKEVMQVSDPSFSKKRKTPVLLSLVFGLACAACVAAAVLPSSSSSTGSRLGRNSAADGRHDDDLSSIISDEKSFSPKNIIDSHDAADTYERSLFAGGDNAAWDNSHQDQNEDYNPQYSNWPQNNYNYNYNHHDNCQDTPNWEDSVGDKCEWYETYDDAGCPTYGHGYDGGLGVAQKACCYCGGGGASQIKVEEKCVNLALTSSDEKDVIAYPCHGGQNQQWTYDPFTKSITSSMNGMCLDVHPETDNVIGWPCHGGSNQQWTLDGGKIRSVHKPSKCLDLDRGESSLIIWTCHGGENQRFKWIPYP